MEARLQRRVQRYGWDKAADHYEGFWQQQLQPAQNLLLKLAALQPGERVLDVACGSGLVTFPAAEAVGPGGHIVATDISQSMVDLAAQIAVERKIDNVSFERMDAEDLRLEESSFDAALCGLGLMYVPDPRLALQEQLRLLKPGGRALAAVWGQRDRCGWAEIFPIVDSRVESEVCPMFFQLGTKEALAQTFTLAGFADVAYERLPSVLRYESAEAALGAAFVGGPVALAYARFDDKTRDEAHADYLKSIEPYRDGDGYNVPGEFVVAIGYKR
ncbi:MAG: methyltransferase domain-containing protein [Dehalococcoidia bacterium]